MYSVAGRLEVLNANVVNVLQSCFSKLCSDFEDAIEWSSLQHQFSLH